MTSVGTGERAALDRDLTVDITTIGRRSGQPRRMETWLYRAAGRYWLTGSPGRRDWYANLLAEPSFTLHLKESAVFDLAVRARPVTDPAERLAVLGEIVPGLSWAREGLDGWLAGSPLVEIVLPE